MERNKPLTTGQAARFCHVSQSTIINWIRRGTLKAYTTPGGHHRILLSDFLSFLRAYGIPVDAALEKSLRARVLVVGSGSDINKLAWTLGQDGEFEVALATDEREADAQVARFDPDAIVLDAACRELDRAGLCRRLRAEPGKKRVLVLATGNSGEEPVHAHGVDAYVADYSIKGLKTELSALLMGS